MTLISTQPLLLDGPLMPGRGLTKRERIVSEALRPAAATEHWPGRLAAKGFAAHADAALSTMTAIDAANAEEEALTIAIALREALRGRAKVWDANL